MSKPLSFFQDLVRERYGRQVVFVAQVGSLNYNLDHKDSDEDYEVYVLPTFSSLYNRQELSVDTNVDGVDVKFKEVGLMGNQLAKSNPNFLQLLFSQNLVYCAPELQWMLEEREKIAAANTQRLYDSLLGMLKNGHSRFMKSRERGEYNGKALVQMLRTSQLLHFYQDDNFTNYQKALYFPDYFRRFYLHVRSGLVPHKGIRLTEPDIEQMMKDAMSQFTYFEDVYKNHPIDHQYLAEFKHKLEQSVRTLFFAQENS